MENETSYNEEIDEFAPAKPDANAPAQPAQPEQPVQPAQPAQPADDMNAYDSIIAQQNEQIAALIAQNQSLTNQITQLVQNGAQIGQMQPAANVSPLQQFMQPSLADSDDWSLESLGREIGKKERKR